jgi:DinB family protein
MTRPTTPYSKYLGDRDAIASLRDSAERIRSLVSAWSREQFERTYAPGKWSARLILTHLAETDMALGYRIRMTLSTPGYVAQPFDQDAWIRRESTASGPEAAAAYYALRQMNLAMFGSLSPADTQTSLTHPDYGPITVDWIIHQMAGHDLNHLEQIERIAKGT